MDSLCLITFFTYPQKLRSKYLSWLNDSLLLLERLPLVTLVLSLLRGSRETYLISARSEFEDLSSFKVFFKPFTLYLAYLSYIELSGRRCTYPKLSAK